MQGGGDSFINLRHFIGVVEDRNDPEKLGRVKVRVYSIHSETKDDIPTKDLPWAMVLQSNNPATSGIGYSGTGMVEGTWVFGIFLDDNFQNPLVLGSMHGKPAIGPDPEKGFNDPRGKYPQQSTDIHVLGESSISRLAKGNDAETHTVLSSKREGKEKLGLVDVAKAPEMSVVISKDVFAQYATRQRGWAEPHPRMGEPGLEKSTDSKKNYSTYPFCHVWYTEGGHALEIDDTPGMERLHWYHKSGTFQEIQDTGDRITKVIGDDYEIDLANKHLYIKGDWNITVDKDVRELINGDKYTEIVGNHFVTVGKNYVKKVTGGEFKEILSDKSTQINKNKSERVSENKTSTVVGNTTVSLSGTKTETVSGEEKKTNLSTSTHILPDNFTLMGANNMNIAAGGNLTIAAEGVLNLTGTANAVLSTPATLDIDANTALTMDSQNGSIDFPAGNITSNEVTLHTHKHTQPDTGADALSQGDTGSPVANT